MEYNTQKYQFNQDGRDYVVSTGLVGDRIRITCQENLALDGPFYSNEFSLEDLKHINQFFILPKTVEEALIEINKNIERQKSGLMRGANDTMIFVGYLVIGTDNDSYNLPLRRDYEPNKYGIFTPPRSSAANLVLQSNYQVDGGRLNSCEKNCGDLEREQTALEDELNKLIPELNKLRKISLDIKEENALIRERLKILQEQLEERKKSVFKLKEENENLKRENLELSNYIKNQENSIREKQAIQATIKVKSRPNISHGKSAVTSKFEQSALRTFFPRTVAKPITEDYIQKKTYISSVPTTINQTNIIQGYEETVLEPKYYNTLYTQETIVSQPPIIVGAEAPDVTYSTKPNLDSNVDYNSQYISNYNTTPTMITTNTVTYNNQNDIPYTSYGQKIQKKSKDRPYTSHKYATEKDIPYTSNMAGAKDVSYTSNMTRTKGTSKDVGYSSANIKGKAKDVAYTGGQRLQKDVTYNSGMANSNVGGYSSQMANTLGDSTGYSNQLLKEKIKYNPTSSNQRPKGSRAPNQNYSSKDGKNKNVPYSSKRQGNNQPDVGYSSFDNK